MELDWTEIDRIIENALREDIGGGDITTDLLFGEQETGQAFFKIKQDGVIAGLPVAERVFKKMDASIDFRAKVEDGAKVKKDQIVAEVRGKKRTILTGERLALNLLQRMSGIATLTEKYVEAVNGLPVKILDTRKTAPGLRALDKYAVRMGGATNHRNSLTELAMIKDNHIKLAGGIGPAVAKIRASNKKIKIEVETSNLEQVSEALKTGADIVMLDNMTIETMKEAVGIINKKALVEASGSITLTNVRAVAETGVDVISIGQLTHSAPALDISMKFSD